MINGEQLAQKVSDDLLQTDKNERTETVRRKTMFSLIKKCLERMGLNKTPKLF